MEALQQQLDEQKHLVEYARDMIPKAEFKKEKLTIWQNGEPVCTFRSTSFKSTTLKCQREFEIMPKVTHDGDYLSIFYKPFKDSAEQGVLFISRLCYGRSDRANITIAINTDGRERAQTIEYPARYKAGLDETILNVVSAFGWQS